MMKRKRQPTPTTVEPTTNNDERQDSDFFGLLQHLSPEEWQSGHKVYIYRLWPVIDKRDDQHYVAKLSEPFDEDVILRNWGSGKYLLKLNNGRGESVASKTVSLHNLVFPPKVSPDEVVQTDPRNERYFKAWPVAASQPAPPAAAPAGGSAPMNGFTEATTQLVLGMSKGRDELAAKLVELAAGANQETEEPNRVLETVETIRAVKELMPPQPAPQTETKTLDSIVQMMSKQNDTLMQLLMQQLNQAKQTQPTEKTSIKEVISLVKDEVLPLVEKLKPGEALDGITRRSKMSGWQEMLQPAIPVVVDFLKPFAAGLATNLFTRAAQPAPPPPLNGSASPAAQPPTPPQPQQNGAMPPLLNMIAPALLNYMRIEADPQELGEDFASWVHEGFQADPRFNSAIAMARAAGPHVIIAQFKGSPWWMDKGPNHDQPSLAEMEGKFGMFTQAFLNWQPSHETIEPDDAPEVINIG